MLLTIFGCGYEVDWNGFVAAIGSESVADVAVVRLVALRDPAGPAWRHPVERDALHLAGLFEPHRVEPVADVVVARLVDAPDPVVLALRRLVEHVLQHPVECVELHPVAFCVPHRVELVAVAAVEPSVDERDPVARVGPRLAVPDAQLAHAA